MKKNDIKILKPFKGLIHLVFPDQYSLASTFIRFQEYYESKNDKLRGHYFTLDEVMDDCVETCGKMDYFDWNGFNIPGEVFDSAYDTFYKHGLREKEKILVELVSGYELFLEGIRIPFTKYYVIGTHVKSDETKHETAHALYYLDVDYKNMVDLFLMQIEPKNKSPLIKWLLNKGYDLTVVNDEIHAYLMDALTGYKEWVDFLKEPQIKLVAENLTILFKERLAQHESDSSL